MEKHTKHVVLYGCSEGIGLTYHLTDMAVALSKILASQTGVEFHLVSTPGEQQSGQWGNIFRHIEPDKVHQCDDLAGISIFVESLLKKHDSQKVVALIQGMKQLASLVALKRKYGNRLFISMRLNSFKNARWYRPLYTWCYSFYLAKHCDFVNFQSDYTASIFWGAKKLFKRGAGGTIPLGCSRPPLVAPDNSSLKELFESEDLIKFVYLAQFHAAKRHLWILDSLRDLIARYDNVRIVFLGDGALKDKVNEQVRNLQMEEKVLCPGRIHRAFIPWILDRANCALVASKSETFGHNFLEPMFFGAPVIGTDVGIGREVIKDYYTGFLIKHFSKKQLQNAFEHFMNNRECFKSYGDNAKRLVGEMFTWESVAGRYVEFLKQV